MPRLAELLEKLESQYGEQAPSWPVDPYEYLVWLHCGYPASDAACAKGWASLHRTIGIDPSAILAADAALLAGALKPGGMVPDLRAQRLREIAERTMGQFVGNLTAALESGPKAQARKALKSFPNIADPGADRILLFAGIDPVAAVPSNCPHVLIRIRAGREHENYGRNYKDAQRIIETETPANLRSRSRAYLLLKAHGQQVCKRTNPKCGECPVSSACVYFARRTG